MDNKKNVHQRLAVAMEAVSYIQRERKKDMKYSITSHDAVTAKVRPALLEAGIVYYPVRCDHTHNGNRAECSMTVRFVNIDEPSDFFDVPTFGYGIDTQDKGPGKAMSYAVKYALLKALGLETGDDPDTENIDHEKDDPALPKIDVVSEIDRIKSELSAATTDVDLRKAWQANQDALRALGSADQQALAYIREHLDQCKAALVARDNHGMAAE